MRVFQNMGKINKKLNLDKDQLYQMYVVDKMSTVDIAKKLGVNSSTTISNYLNLYGIPRRTMSDASKEKWRQWSPELIKQKGEKMSRIWHNKSPEEQARLLKALWSNTNTPEAIEKIINTKRKNGTFNTSSVEESIYNSLVEKYFNVKRNYNEDPRYPFQCDFYIPDQDLFIEVNHHPTHYKEPFDETNPEHVAYLEHCKLSPKNWVEKDLPRVWAGYDKKKINTAIENNLNYIIIYPKQSYKIENGKLVALQSNEL